MLKYAKVINDTTKACEVGLGTNASFYQSLGMTEQEVEQAYNGAWYLKGYAPQKTLAELKEAKRAEINAARDAAEQGGFEYMGKVFDSDPISCQRISCAAQAMQISALAATTPTITWTCQDNTTIDLNPSELLGLVGALAAWSNSCHIKATALKEQIEACQSAEALAQISWDKGE